MGSVNRTIVVAVIIIMAAGIYHLFLQSSQNAVTSPALTRIIVGAYMLGLFASFFDLIGFGVGQVAGWILMLSVGVSVLAVASDLVNRYNTARLPNPTSGGPGNFK